GWRGGRGGDGGGRDRRRRVRRRTGARAGAERRASGQNRDASVQAGAVAVVRRCVHAAPVRRMGAQAAPGAAVIDGYLGYLRDVRRLSANTVESYAPDLAALASFAEKKGRAVEALERRDLEAFARKLMADGLSPRSVARAIACVRGYYKFLLADRKIAADPAEDFRAPRAWPALPKYLGLDEVDRLLAQPDPSTPRGLRDKALVELLYATGLRVT